MAKKTITTPASQPLPWRMVPWHIVEGPPEIRDANGYLVCEVATDDIAKFICEAVNAKA